MLEKLKLLLGITGGEKDALLLWCCWRRPRDISSITAV
jgi:hypothetical protein